MPSFMQELASNKDSETLKNAYKTSPPSDLELINHLRVQLNNNQWESLHTLSQLLNDPELPSNYPLSWTIHLLLFYNAITSKEESQKMDHYGEGLKTTSTQFSAVIQPSTAPNILYTFVNECLRNWIKNNPQNLIELLGELIGYIPLPLQFHEGFISLLECFCSELRKENKNKIHQWIFHSSNQEIAKSLLASPSCLLLLSELSTLQTYTPELIQQRIWGASHQDLSLRIGKVFSFLPMKTPEEMLGFVLRLFIFYSKGTAILPHLFNAIDYVIKNGAANSGGIKDNFQRLKQCSWQIIHPQEPYEEQKFHLIFDEIAGNLPKLLIQIVNLWQSHPLAADYFQQLEEKDVNFTAETLINIVLQSKESSAANWQKVENYLQKDPQKAQDFCQKLLKNLQSTESLPYSARIKKILLALFPHCQKLDDKDYQLFFTLLSQEDLENTSLIEKLLAEKKLIQFLPQENEFAELLDNFYQRPQVKAAAIPIFYELACSKEANWHLLKIHDLLKSQTLELSFFEEAFKAISITQIHPQALWIFLNLALDFIETSSVTDKELINSYFIFLTEANPSEEIQQHFVNFLDQLLDKKIISQQELLTHATFIHLVKTWVKKVKINELQVYPLAKFLAQENCQESELAKEWQFITFLKEFFNSSLIPSLDQINHFLPLLQEERDQIIEKLLKRSDLSKFNFLAILLLTKQVKSQKIAELFANSSENLEQKSILAAALLLHPQINDLSAVHQVNLCAHIRDGRHLQLILFSSTDEKAKFNAVTALVNFLGENKLSLAIWFADLSLEKKFIIPLANYTEAQQIKNTNHPVVQAFSLPDFEAELKNYLQKLKEGELLKTEGLLYPYLINSWRCPWLNNSIFSLEAFIHFEQQDIKPALFSYFELLKKKEFYQRILLELNKESHYLAEKIHFLRWFLLLPLLNFKPLEQQNSNSALLRKLDSKENQVCEAALIEQHQLTKWSLTYFMPDRVKALFNFDSRQEFSKEELGELSEDFYNSQEQLQVNNFSDEIAKVFLQLPKTKCFRENVELCYFLIDQCHYFLMGEKVPVATVSNLLSSIPFTVLHEKLKQMNFVHDFFNTKGYSLLQKINQNSEIEFLSNAQELEIIDLTNLLTLSQSLHLQLFTALIAFIIQVKKQDKNFYNFLLPVEKQTDFVYQLLNQELKSKNEYLIAFNRLVMEVVKYKKDEDLDERLKYLGLWLGRITSDKDKAIVLNSYKELLQEKNHAQSFLHYLQQIINSENKLIVSYLDETFLRKIIEIALEKPAENYKLLLLIFSTHSKNKELLKEKLKSYFEKETVLDLKTVSWKNLVRLPKEKIQEILFLQQLLYFIELPEPFQSWRKNTNKEEYYSYSLFASNAALLSLLEQMTKTDRLSVINWEPLQSYLKQSPFNLLELMQHEQYDPKQTVSENYYLLKTTVFFTNKAPLLSNFFLQWLSEVNFSTPQSSEEEQYLGLLLEDIIQHQQLAYLIKNLDKLATKEDKLIWLIRSILNKTQLNSSSLALIAQNCSIKMIVEVFLQNKVIPENNQRSLLEIALKNNQHAQAILSTTESKIEFIDTIKNFTLENRKELYKNCGNPKIKMLLAFELISHYPDPELDSAFLATAIAEIDLSVIPLALIAELPETIVINFLFSFRHFHQLTSAIMTQFLAQITESKKEKVLIDWLNNNFRLPNAQYPLLLILKEMNNEQLILGITELDLFIKAVLFAFFRHPNLEIDQMYFLDNATEEMLLLAIHVFYQNNSARHVEYIVSIATSLLVKKVEFKFPTIQQLKTLYVSNEFSQLANPADKLVINNIINHFLTTHHSTEQQQVLDFFYNEQKQLNVQFMQSPINEGKPENRLDYVLSHFVVEESKLDALLVKYFDYLNSVPDQSVHLGSTVSLLLKEAVSVEIRKKIFNNLLNFPRLIDDKSATTLFQYDSLETLKFFGQQKRYEKLIELCKNVSNPSAAIRRAQAEATLELELRNTKGFLASLRVWFKRLAFYKWNFFTENPAQFVLFFNSDPSLLPSHKTVKAREGTTTILSGLQNNPIQKSITPEEQVDLLSQLLNDTPSLTVLVQIIPLLADINNYFKPYRGEKELRLKINSYRQQLNVDLKQYPELAKNCFRLIELHRSNGEENQAQTLTEELCQLSDYSYLKSTLPRNLPFAETQPTAANTQPNSLWNSTWAFYIYYAKTPIKRISSQVSAMLDLK